MHQTKFLETLRSLTPQEFKRFSRFVESPYFNKNERLIQFVAYLSKYAPDFDHQGLHRERVYKKLFPFTTFDEQKVREQTSFLYKLLKQFLVVEARAQKPFDQDLLLLKQFRRRGLEIPFEILEKKMTPKVEKGPFRHEAYYLNQFLLAVEKDRMFAQKGERKFDESLQDISNNFDLYYLANKLKLSCRMLNRNNLIQSNYQPKLTEGIIEQLVRSYPNYLFIPIIQIYYSIYHALKDKSKENHFFQLKELLGRYAHLYPKDDAREMYKYAQNYCIQMINDGQNRFLSQLFDLYLQQFENKIIFKKGILSARDYKNLLTTGIKLQYQDRVWKMMHDYKALLSADLKEDVFHYNLIQFYYAFGQEEKLVQLMDAYTFQNIHYYVGSKYVLYQTMYNRQQFQALVSDLETFKLYVTRHRSLNHRSKQETLGFIRILLKTVEMKQQYSQWSGDEFELQYEKFISSIDKSKNIANIGWLKKQVQELKSESSIKI